MEECPSNTNTITRRFSAASSASARCSQNIEAAGTPGPTEESDRYSPERGCHEVTGVGIAAKKKLGGQPSLFLCLLQAKQIYLLSAVATSTAQATLNLPLGCYRWRIPSCELCVRVHSTHSVGHSLRSEYQHLPYEPLKPYKPLLYIRIITPS